jgi:hypothetical protein
MRATVERVPQLGKYTFLTIKYNGMLAHLDYTKKAKP